MHNRDEEWRTADGRTILVKDMKDSHLVNVINWIFDNPEHYPSWVGELMIAEASYRQTLLFAEGKAYPQKVGKRWKLIDPKTGEGKIEKPPQEYIDSVKHNPVYKAMSKQTQIKRRRDNGTF